jgi:hypothetical protein
MLEGEVLLTWLMPMHWSNEDGAGAEGNTESEGEKPDDKKSAEAAGGNEEGDGDSPEISDEDRTLLKAAGVDPDSISELSQEALDQVIKMAKSGAVYKDKLREVEKAERKKESQERAKRLELAQAKLITDDGNLDKKALTTLTDLANKAEGLQTLFDSLVENGHVTEAVANVIHDSKSPEIAAAVLKHIPVETADPTAEALAMAKKMRGVNSEDRGSAGGSSTVEDEATKRKKQTEANLESLMNRERGLPQRSK